MAGLVATARRHRWMLLAGTVAAVALVMALGSQARRYTAEATFLVGPIGSDYKQVRAAEQQAQTDNVLVDVDDLWVKACYADIGTTKYRRRVRPAPIGRAYRERRHYSHLTVVVSSEKRKGEAAEAE